MTNERFIQLCNKTYTDVFLETFGIVPRDTGNLQDNGIQMRFPDLHTCIIEVNQDIVPYMIYTNEPWISKKWHGKKNPNENWWQFACQYFIEEFAKRVKSGRLSRVGEEK